MRLALALAILAAPLLAQEADIIATDALIAETSPVSRAAAGYVTITNTGERPYVLTAVESPVLDADLHQTLSGADGIVRMEGAPESFAVEPGGTLRLARGGRHVMFTGLTGPLTAGTAVEAVLVFGDALRLPVEFRVVTQAQIAAEPMTHGAMDHGPMDHGPMDHGPMDHGPMDHGPMDHGPASP